MSERLRPVDSSAPPALVAEMAGYGGDDAAPGLHRFLDALRSRFGDALSAVLLYGSCLRQMDARDGVVDLYAIVTGYRDAYPQRRLRALNAWLPPNVFYLELGGPGAVLRAKYAVLSLGAFETGIRSWFHPYLWARFCQPIRLLYARDAGTEQRLQAALALAVVRMLRESASTMEPQEVDAEALWIQAFGLSYGAELRPEPQRRAVALVEQDRDLYRRLTALACPALRDQIELLADGRYRVLDRPRLRRRLRRRWWARRWQGRILSILRLAKAALTFQNSIDYAAWKIERHTGVRIEVTPRLRRHPLLYGWAVLWQLLRTGVLR